MNILGSFTITVKQAERTFEECDRLKDAWQVLHNSHLLCGSQSAM